MSEDSKPQRIKPRSTSPLADANAFQPAPTPPRVNGKFAKRQPIDPVAAKKRAEAEARAEEEPEAEEVVKPKRRPPMKRVPFGRREAKLTFPPREGFTRRFFNDDPGRVERALLAGYVHVEVNGRPHTHPGGTNKENTKRTLYLMEIPTEFYDEDFAAKQEALDEVDQTIYKGVHNKEPGDGRYRPRTVPPRVDVRRGQGSG